MLDYEIHGGKGGGETPHTPVETPNNLLSVAYAKVLIAVAEGELAGVPTDQDIFLDGTPLTNPDGSKNFGGVKWEWRPGTSDQTYIAGLPEVSTEYGVGIELKSDSPYVRTVTKSQLDAVRVTFQWPALLEQKSNGDTVGVSIDYSIEISTAGGPFVEYKTYNINGKTNTPYERTHRVDLPKSSSGWIIRAKKITKDTTVGTIQDQMNIKSFTEVVDVKQRYPNTALLYVEFDSSTFGGGAIPKISVRTKGRLIRVPSNYDPVTRSYSGVWAGDFKWAWSDNPAWVFHDIITQDRFGLGNKVNLNMVDKWSLYEIAQYCDVMVDDGHGVGVLQPRHTCNIYIQEKQEAWQVLRDIASIFNGMTYWNGNQFTAIADKQEPLTNLPIFSRSNVVNGTFNYTAADDKSIYTSALVSYDDPENHYGSDVESTFETEQILRWGGDRQIEISAIGCTARGEAQRRGKYALITNMYNRTVSFQTGLQGLNDEVMPGKLIHVLDPLIGGRPFTGRIVVAAGQVLTLDRTIDGKAGDVMYITKADGTSEGRTIQAVSGKIVTLQVAYTNLPAPNSVWYLEAADLKSQLFRVTKITSPQESVFEIEGVEYNDSKYAAVDTGARLEPRAISVVPPSIQKAPTNVKINSFTYIEQEMSVSTMTISWDQTQNAVGYEVQWKVGNGDWINVGTTGANEVNIRGVFTGDYIARVRAINSLNIKSVWESSVLTTLQGKKGTPPSLTSLTVSSLVYGMRVNWTFPDGASDTSRTELMYGPTPAFSGATKFGDYAYPQKSLDINGLKAGQQFYFWARIVDKTGNVGPYYPLATVNGVLGTASTDVLAYEEYFKNKITESSLGKNLATTINLITADQSVLGSVSQKVADEATARVTTDIKAAQDLATEAKTRADADKANVTAITKEVTDRANAITAEATARTNAIVAETNARVAADSAEAQTRADAILNERLARTAAITAEQTIRQTTDESLASAISTLAAGTGEQFDSKKVWYFDNDLESWSGNGAPTVSGGYLRPANNATDPYVVSPLSLGIDGSTYKYTKLRIKKTGSPRWIGQLFWQTVADKTWNETKSVTIAAPTFDKDGDATIDFKDIPWASDLYAIRLDLTTSQTATDYVLIDWIAIGRPSPGASVAALQDEATARVTADSAEALQRSTLAAQMRGNYIGTDVASLTEGILYNERVARVTADSAMSSDINTLKSTVNDPSKGVVATSNAVIGLTTRVITAEGVNTSQGSAITSLNNSLNTTNNNVTATNTELNSLTGRVTTAEGKVTSQGDSITELKNTVSGKADSSTVNALSNAVTSQGTTITAQGNAITSINSNLAGIGGDNLLPNSSFEELADGSTTRPKYWNIGGNGIPSLVSSPLSLSTKALRINRTATPNASYIDLINGQVDGKARVKVTEGKSYILTSYVRGPVGNFRLQMYFQFLNASGALLGTPTSTQFAVSEIFQRYSLSGVAPSGAVSVNIYAARLFNNGPTSDIWMEVDNVQFQEGTMATAYAPSISLTASDSANAINELDARVTNTEGAVVSQGTAISSLNNKIDGKADANAVNSLNSRVTTAEGNINSTTSNVTSLTNAIRATNSAGSNIIPNPTFDPAFDQMGFNVLTSNTTGVPANCPFKYVAKLASRDHLPTINSVPFTPVKAGDVWRISVLVACASGSVPFRSYIEKGSDPNTYLAVLNGDGMTPASSNWVRSTWDYVVPNNTFFIRPFLQIEQSASSPTTVWYATDWHMENITAAKTAQTTADATSSAVSGLTSTVTQQGSTITSQGNRVTSLENSVNNANTGLATKASSVALDTLNSKVTNQGNTITSQGSRVTSLENTINSTTNGLATKASATSLTNLSNNVTQQGNTITSQGNSLTSLKNSVDGLDTKVSGQATSISNIDTRVTQVDGKVNTLATRTDGIFVQVNPNMAGDDTLLAGSDTGSVGVWSETSARIEDGVALGQRIDVVNAKFDNTNASVVSETLARVSGDQALAQRIDTVQVGLGNTNAAVQQTSSAVVTLDGKASTMWSVKMQVNAQGQYVTAGVGLGLENGPGGLQSNFLVNADTFAVVNGINGTLTTPFVVSGGQVFIKSALIQDASINFLKIGDNVQSSNYVPGSTGWRLAKDGGFEINGVTAGQGRIAITNSSLTVFDANGVKRVQLGLLG